MVEVLPNKNILKVAENCILTTYDPSSYAEVWSLTLRLCGAGSQIADAALIDANNILIATFDKAWSVNMVTGAETDGGNSISSDKYANPVK